MIVPTIRAESLPSLREVHRALQSNQWLHLDGAGGPTRRAQLVAAGHSQVRVLYGTGGRFDAVISIHATPAEIVRCTT